MVLFAFADAMPGRDDERTGKLVNSPSICCA